MVRRMATSVAAAMPHLSVRLPARNRPSKAVIVEAVLAAVWRHATGSPRRYQAHQGQALLGQALPLVPGFAVPLSVAGELK